MTIQAPNFWLNIDHYKTDFNGSQYYSFNYLNVQLLIMSTEAAYGSDSAQYNFVQRDLQNALVNLILIG